MAESYERVFGKPRRGLEYEPRACAYGLAQREDGRILMVKIVRSLFSSEYDLPGGAIDPGETEIEAMVREYREETGRACEPVEKIGSAAQYWLKRSHGPVLNICNVYAVRLTGGPSEPDEADHEPIWMRKRRALRLVRHEALRWLMRRYLDA